MPVLSYNSTKFSMLGLFALQQVRYLLNVGLIAVVAGEGPKRRLALDGGGKVGGEEVGGGSGSGAR